MMRSLDDVFPRLAKSTFRAWFSLGPKERAYLHERGMAVMLEHAADFVAKRLAPAEPPNDGKQTPMRGHPVFIAQHATATCCAHALQSGMGFRLVGCSAKMNNATSWPRSAAGSIGSRR